MGEKVNANLVVFSSVQFSSVNQSFVTLCDPMNLSTPGLPVHHQLPEFTQTHVHRVSHAIQPSHPLSSPSPPAPSCITYCQIPFCKGWSSFHFQQQHVRMRAFPQPCHQICSNLLTAANAIGEKCYLSVVLIYIYFIMN